MLDLFVALLLFFVFVFLPIRWFYKKSKKFYNSWSSEEKLAFWSGFFSAGKRSSSRYDHNDDGGNYVIQYRSRGTGWIDGPGSNSERIAESMFDSFLENDPRGSKRCRLVEKKNGRVVSVISTN